MERVEPQFQEQRWGTAEGAESKLDLEADGGRRDSLKILWKTDAIQQVEGGGWGAFKVEDNFMLSSVENAG